MDPLEIFFDWFFTKCRTFGHAPVENVAWDANGIMGVVWYRQTPFQAQLFIVPPNFIIPEHHHPNVDSFELYVGGQIMFSHKGKWTVSSEMLSPDKNGVAKMHGSFLRVRPDDTHGGAFGPSGGVFFSVQHWINGQIPSCVSKDYEGIAVNEGHKTVVGNLVHKELTWRDAASDESISPFWITE